MFGFRQGLATQELLLQLQHEIIEGRGCSSRDTSAVLGLDLSKAFNIETHLAILESYMRNWMWPKIPTTTLGISSWRKQPASLIGDLKSNPHVTRRTGLASRLISSPTLFNVALRLANWTKYWDWGTAGTPTWHYGYPEVVMETLGHTIGQIKSIHLLSPCTRWTLHIRRLSGKMDEVVIFNVLWNGQLFPLDWTVPF